MLHHSLNQHTQPFILAREFSFRTMSFYRFAVRTVPPTALLFPWMLWEIIESAVYGAVCRGAPTSMCLVNTVSLKSPPWAVGSGFLTVPRCQPSLETRAKIKNSYRSFIAAPADAGGFWSIFEFACSTLILPGPTTHQGFFFNCWDVGTRVSHAPPCVLSAVQQMEGSRRVSTRANIFQQQLEMEKIMKLDSRGQLVDSTIQLFQ